MIKQCPATGRQCELTGCVGTGCALTAQPQQEPVAWRYKYHAQTTADEYVWVIGKDRWNAQEPLAVEGLYGPEALAYADWMRAERDAARAELDEESLRLAASDLEVTKWQRWARWARAEYLKATGKTLEADSAA